MLLLWLLWLCAAVRVRVRWFMRVSLGRFTVSRCLVVHQAAALRLMPRTACQSIALLVVPVVRHQMRPMVLLRQQHSGKNSRILFFGMAQRLIVGTAIKRTVHLSISNPVFRLV